jgi:NAD(P)-dependent dehydrogenase (short-subunit alcohol dehydrogenase family)
MADAVCLITGVGPGTGAALARRFGRGGHRVAMLARDPAAALDAACTAVASELGPPTVVVHNAVGGALSRSVRSASAGSVARSARQGEPRCPVSAS